MSVTSPDLVEESGQRAIDGAWAASALRRSSSAPANVNVPGEGSRTIGWPDPYGPDPVVFGSEPCAGPHVIGIR